MIKVITVGRVKERYLQQGIDEFLKRLKPSARIDLIPVKDSKPDEEGKRILKEARGCFLVALDQRGEQMSSEGLASFIKKGLEKDLCFAIGGPDGLSEEVIEKADMVLSLSEMTYTHEMCLLFLLEQLYRAEMINSGRSYHR